MTQPTVKRDFARSARRRRIHTPRTAPSRAANWLRGLPARLTASARSGRGAGVALLQAPLAGFRYYRGLAIWDFLREGEPLRLVREPFNPADPMAVAVYFRNEKLGYLPRSRNRAIAGLLDRGTELQGRIERLQPGADPRRRVRIGVAMLSG